MRNSIKIDDSLDSCAKYILFIALVEFLPCLSLYRHKCVKLEFVKILKRHRVIFEMFFQLHESDVGSEGFNVYNNLYVKTAFLVCH